MTASKMEGENHGYVLIMGKRVLSKTGGHHMVATSSDGKAIITELRSETNRVLSQTQQRSGP